jgi:hypothetical protein
MGGEVVEVFEGVVLEPGDVEVRLGAGRDLVVREGAEPFALDSLIPCTADSERGGEVVEVGAPELALFQGEVLVGTEVVHPQSRRPRVSDAGFLSKDSTFAFTPPA